MEYSDSSSVCILSDSAEDASADEREFYEDCANSSQAKQATYTVISPVQLQEMQVAIINISLNAHISTPAAACCRCKLYRL